MSEEKTDYCIGTPPLARRNFLPISPNSPQEDIKKQLLAETEHFFVIPGLGSFVPGYAIIVSKGNEHASANLPPEVQEEFQWLRDTVTEAIQESYQLDTATFEHDMIVSASNASCAEIPHLHIMPIPREGHETEDLDNHNHISKGSAFHADQAHAMCREDAINRTFNYRMGGELSKPANISLATIRKTLSEYQTFPKGAEKLMDEGTAYVYFDCGDGKNAYTAPYCLNDHPDFQAKLARANKRFEKDIVDGETTLGSQIGRQMVAKMWGIEKDPAQEIWNWRVSGHEGYENMHHTARTLAPKLKALCQEDKAEQFGYVNHTGALLEQHRRQWAGHNK